MIPEPTDQFYTAWQPVRINAGFGSSMPKGSSGFWINGTGLQWTSELDHKPSSLGNAFGGWFGESSSFSLSLAPSMVLGWRTNADEILVCDWWHGVPQLFFRINGYYDKAPCSCADVDLCPEYL